MVFIKRFIELLLNDRLKLYDYIVKKFFSFLPDKLFLSFRYRFQMGCWVDWQNPKTFTEKIQWLKLYNRKPEYTTWVDKSLVKKYVASIIGDKYIIPTLGIWQRTSQIDWNSLPNKFVLKTTHGGGSCGVVICKNKDIFDKEKAVASLDKSLKYDIYKDFREWPYKNVKKGIIAELYMEDAFQTELNDYKFFCFNGEPLYCQVIRDRHVRETIDFYDMEWKHQEFVGLNPNVTNGLTPVERPVCLAEMIDICRKLSINVPFIRVDLYIINSQVYFGELTFFPASGFGMLSPVEWNRKLGDLLLLE